jgi:ABC-type multidrug transport system fused ATPase/permease subunit
LAVNQANESKPGPPSGKANGPADEANPNGAVGNLSNWQMIRRMLGLAWEHRRGCIAVLLLYWLLLFMVLAALSLTGLGLAVIRHAVTPDSTPPVWPLGITPPAGYSPMGLVVLIGILVLVVALGHAIMRVTAEIMQALLVQRILVALRARVYDKLQRLSFHFFDANESGSIINRVTTDVQSVRLFVDGVIVESLTIVLSLAFYLAYMLRLNWKLTLACLATTPVMWVGVAMFSRMVRPAYRKNRTLMDRLVLTLQENLLGIRVVKGFNREPQQMKKFNADNAAVRNQKHWIFWRITTFVPVIQILATVNILVLLGYGGYLVIHDANFPVDQGLVVFAGLLQVFSAQLRGVATVADSIQRSLTGAQRVFEILDWELEIQNKPDAKKLGRPKGALSFEGVSFGYETDKPIIEEIELQIEPGQCVAILGRTGSGKSTLLSLIPRFYDPQKGRVTIDGIDVRDLDLDDFRKQIGIVFQQSFLFSNTVAANIAFGMPDAKLEQIERAAKLASAHEFITQLPNGYDTIIGENGVDLSGGQRQRLAIARALISDPPILILDDATAAVDPETEHQIMEGIDQATEGRTTLIVAHRLSTLRRADVAIVMDQGRIVQRGTHEELMDKAGHYQDAAAVQVADMESKRLLGLA